MLELEDMAILAELLSQEIVSLTTIGEELGFKEQRIRAGVDRLVGLGCNIESSDPTGYRLVSTGLETWENYLSYALTHSALSIETVRVYQETASTQAVAKALAPQESLVLADQQTAGRGRLGRPWLSAPGACVLMSMTKRITGMPGSYDRLSMFVGVAVARAVEQVSPGTSARLKWPNDIMVGGRKLAGILIEAAAETYIIGIGLNVLHQDRANSAFDQIATSLAEIGRPVDRLHIIEAILCHIGNVLRNADPQPILDEWRIRTSLGQTQTFEQAGERITGEVLDLDPDHGLIVRRDSGEIVVLPAATTSVVK